MNTFYYVKNITENGKLLTFKPIVIICLKCKGKMQTALEQNYYPSNFQKLAEEIKILHSNHHPNCLHSQEQPLQIVRRSDETEKETLDTQIKFNLAMYGQNHLIGI
jgi:hypothetical protein